MRLNQYEKMELIRLVENSPDSTNKTLQELGIHKRTFYNWYNAYKEYGFEGLAPKISKRKYYWNQIPEQEKKLILDMALDYPEKSSREIACLYTDTFERYVSESSVYRILKRNGLIQTPAYDVIKAADEFKDKTTAVNQMWQTDFTYFKIQGWGWYFLSTVIDDYSRHIIHWKLYSTMRAEDAQETIQQAILKSNLKSGARPGKVLSDNGSSYIADSFRSFLTDQGIRPVNGRPLHPQTQGKIERYHKSLKSVIKLDVYHTPGALEKAIDDFVNYYTYERYHESLDNVAPIDVYFGRHHSILKKRQQIKNNTIVMRRKEYYSSKYGSG
jgi:putative transposase